MESPITSHPGLEKWYAHGATIPATSFQVYLTGMAALNIPAPEGTSGDWHRIALFGNSSRRLPVAGEAPEALVNTNPILGTFGVHECSGSLRSIGLSVPHEQKVFSANHIRAILDLVIHGADTQKPVNFLQASDFLDTDDQMNLLKEGVEVAGKNLEGARALYLRNWFEQQSSDSLSRNGR